MSQLLLLTAVMFVVVVHVWFAPQPYRPWCRAALLVGATFVAPRSSFFMWLVWTTPFVVTASLLLTYREPGSFRMALRDGLTGRASALANTHRAVPFLRIAVATCLVVSWAWPAPRHSPIPWVIEAALVLVNAALIVPKGARRWFFLSLYYLAAACALGVSLVRR